MGYMNNFMLSCILFNADHRTVVYILDNGMYTNTSVAPDNLSVLLSVIR